VGYIQGGPKTGLFFERRKQVVENIELLLDPNKIIVGAPCPGTPYGSIPLAAMHMPNAVCDVLCPTLQVQISCDVILLCCVLCL